MGTSCGSSTVASPVNGTVTSGFGPRWGRNHDGLDIAAPAGTAIRAAACGSVTIAGTQSGYGNIVCITHNSSFSTCYAHMSRFAVSQGAQVRQGQVIGYVGCTGSCTGPHVHFETRVNGQAQDPRGYLDGAVPGGSAAAAAGAATGAAGGPGGATTTAQGGATASGGSAAAATGAAQAEWTPADGGASAPADVAAAVPAEVVAGVPVEPAATAAPVAPPVEPAPVPVEAAPVRSRLFEPAPVPVEPSRLWLRRSSRRPCPSSPHLWRRSSRRLSRPSPLPAPVEPAPVPVAPEPVVTPAPVEGAPATAATHDGRNRSGGSGNRVDHGRRAGPGDSSVSVRCRLSGRQRPLTRQWISWRAGLRVGVDRVADVDPVEDLERVRDRHPQAAVAGRVAGYRRVSVDRVAPDEVRRVDHPLGVGARRL